MTDESPDPTTPSDPDISDAAHAAPSASPDGIDLPEVEDSDDVPELDLDAVERDLAAVETALQRLSEGTYWTDEVTGEPIAEHILAADPTARRA